MKYILIFILACSTSYSSLYEKPFGGKLNGRNMGGELALDIYAPYLSLNMDLRKRHTISEVKENEWELYMLMLKNAFVPGYLAIETSVYPMVIVNNKVYERSQSDYQKFNMLNDETNLLEMLSADYNDPIAYSVFLGELMSFRKQVQGRPPQNGYGLMGYVISYGMWSSFKNQFIRDNWIEVKWKIKGVKSYEDSHRIWKLVVGYSFHEQVEFLDNIVFELSRDLKTRKRAISLLENTMFSVDVKIAPFVPLDQFVEKQAFGVKGGVFYPLGKSIYISMATGIRKELLREKITGNLISNVKFFLVPSIDF